MTAALHTPGPWSYQEQSDAYTHIVREGDGSPGGGRFIVQFGQDTSGVAEANARLTAAAPDHADIAWATCVAGARWEPWNDGRGEFILNFIRFVTELDAFGIPTVNAPMRAAIAHARNES